MRSIDIFTMFSHDLSTSSGLVLGIYEHVSSFEDNVRGQGSCLLLSVSSVSIINLVKLKKLNSGDMFLELQNSRQALHSSLQRVYAKCQVVPLLGTSIASGCGSGIADSTRIEAEQMEAVIENFVHFFASIQKPFKSRAYDMSIELLR